MKSVILKHNCKSTLLAEREVFLVYCIGTKFCNKVTSCVRYTQHLQYVLQNNSGYWQTLQNMAFQEDCLGNICPDIISIMTKLQAG